MSDVLRNGIYTLNGKLLNVGKYTTMPTASVGFVGKIVQYTGTTTVNYINGYFYKGIATNMPSVATADITEATGITEATVNKTTFEGELPTSGVYDFIYKEGSATGSVGSSTGVTSATVVKATFEALLATAGAYDFEFTDYLVTASIGASAGITSASVVKATFKSQLSTTGDYVFTYTASTASASIVGSTGISGATVDVAVFETLLATTGDYVFTFDGTDWKYDSNVVTLADYGIVATGTPNLNDVITISYAEDKWEYDSGTVLLSTYGITYEGTPADSDTITISYVEELWEYDGSEVTLADYGITAVGTPADGDIITVTLIVDNWYYLTNIVTLSDYGIVATGTPDYDDTITITYAVAYVAYSWLRIDVQPAGSTPSDSTTTFAVKSSNVDSNELTDIASINEITNVGCSATAGIVTGGKNKYLQLTRVVPFSTANSWEIKTKYTHVTGATKQTIFGWDGSEDYKAPVLYTDSNTVKLFLSSNGTAWDLFSTQSMSLTLTTETTYYLKFSFSSVNGYKLEYSSDDVSYTTAWSDAATTKCFCGVPFKFLNLGNLDDYYSLGSIDLNETVITIDSVVWFSYSETLSFKIDDGTLYAPLTIVSADGTETTLTTVSDLDLSSLSTGRINIFFNSSGAVAYNNTIFNQTNQPTALATNDIWFNNLNEAKKWSGSAWVVTDLVFGLYVIKNSILETYLNVPANYNGTSEKLVKSYTLMSNHYDIWVRPNFKFYIVQYNTFRTISNAVTYYVPIYPMLNDCYCVTSAGSSSLVTYVETKNSISLKGDRNILNVWRVEGYIA